MDYTEVNDETISALAKLTLSLFDEYDKILVRRTFYTSRLERCGKIGSSTDYKTNKVVVYCEKPQKGDYGLVFLGLMIELFDQDMVFGDKYYMEHINTINRNMVSVLYFSTNYRELGFKTIDKYEEELCKLSKETSNLVNDIYKYKKSEEPLTEDDKKELQKLEKRRDELFDTQMKLYEGLYMIKFDSFRVTKKDGCFEVNNCGAIYTGYTEWNSVAELAEIE